MHTNRTLENTSLYFIGTLFMRHKLQNGLVYMVLLIAISGCASYRTTSNVMTKPETTQSTTPISILPSGTELNKAHQIIQRIDVSVKKLTLFHADPTKGQVNSELEQRAKALGCDAVINVQYQSGIGLTTWGYMDAQGDCVKFK